MDFFLSVFRLRTKFQEATPCCHEWKYKDQRTNKIFDILLTLNTEVSKIDAVAEADLGLLQHPRWSTF